MKLVVGLGNPDSKYSRTYHNIGFMAVEKIAHELGGAFTKRMCDGVVAEARVNGEKVMFVKPLTYMNLSGICVRQIKQKFKLEDSDIFVFVDDIDLPLGKVRFRENGSGGTHNGLRNIVEELNSQNFNRIKIGVGRDEKFADLGDFVLSRIPDDKMEIIEKEIDEGIELLKKHL